MIDNKNLYITTSCYKDVPSIGFKNGSRLYLSSKPQLNHYDLHCFRNYLKVKDIQYIVNLDIYDKGLYSLLYKNWRINFLNYPIYDYSIPTNIQGLEEAIQWVRRSLMKGSVLIHCYAGNGRTGLFAACVFVKMGLSASRSINFIRQYNKKAIETLQQKDFIYLYENYCKEKRNENF